MTFILPHAVDISVASTAQRARKLLLSCQKALIDDHDTYQLSNAQLSRFDLWASNIGVFSSRHSSLDYRLRTAPAVKAAIDGNLEILCKNILDTLAGRSPLTDDELDDFANTDLQEVFSFGIQLYNTSSTTQEARNARIASLELVEATIDVLHRLSLAIRKSSNRNSLARVPKLIGSDGGYILGKTSEELLSKSGVTVDSIVFEATAAFEEFVRRVLQSRWLSTDVNETLDDAQKRYREVMFQRCVTVIATRRLQLTYFQNHQAKLAKADKDVVSKPDLAITQHTSALPVRNPPGLAFKGSILKESGPVVSIPLDETVPSEFNVASFRPPSTTSAPSSTGTVSIVGSLNASGPFEVPPAPELAGIEKEKMCPYCCLVYPARIFSANNKYRRWRKHLIEDLQPYVCLFENCDEAGKAYRNFKDWQAHLSQSHVQRWVCPLAHESQDIAGSESLIFDTVSEFQEHFNFSHTRFDTTELNSLVQVACQRAELPRWCFVCMAKQNNDVMLQKHLAKHLEAAFILSLPERDDIKDADTASSGLPSGYGEPLSEVDFLEIRDLYPDANSNETVEPQHLSSEEFNTHLATYEIYQHSTQGKSYLLNSWVDGQLEVPTSPETLSLSNRWRVLIILLKTVIYLHKAVKQKTPLELTQTSDNRAAVLIGKGKYVEAELIYRETLALRKTMLGEEHPSTLDSMNALALTLSHQGRHIEAENMCQEVLALRRNLLGEEHPDTLNSMHALALTLGYQGKFVEAEQIYQKVLALRTKVLGEGHPDTIYSMDVLARELNWRRKFTEAEKMHQEMLTICKRAFGEQHIHTLRSMSALGGTLNEQKKYAEAEQMYQEALALHRKVLGEGHLDTLASMSRLARVLRTQMKHTEAEKMYRELLSLHKKVLGENHLDTLASMYGLGRALSGQMKHMEAEQMYRKLLSLRKEVSGENHPDTLASMNALAGTLSNQMKYTEAEQIYEEELVLRKKIFGTEHPHIRNSIRQSRAIYLNQERVYEAETLESQFK